MNQRSSMFYFLCLLLIFNLVDAQQYPRRTLTQSELFLSFTVYYRRWTGLRSDYVFIPTTLGKFDNSTHYVAHFQGYVGLRNYKNLTGYEMVSYIVDITPSLITIQMASFHFCGDQGLCLPNYIHYRVILYAAAYQSPISRIMTPSFTNRALYGFPGNTELITVYTKVNFAIQQQIKDYCYVDRQKTTRDKLHVWQINNALFFPDGLLEATSVPPNRVYTYNVDQYLNKNITWNFSINTYYTTKSSFFTSILIAYCPNAYYFTQKQIYFHFGETIDLPTNIQGSVRQLKYTQSIDDDRPPVIQFSLVKLDGSNPNAEYVQIYYNITAWYDQNTGKRVPNSLRFWYRSNMPNTAVLNYIILGRYANCYNNYEQLNKTHCFCNSSKYLYYDPILSYSHCSLICPSNMYKNQELQICILCNATYGLGCIQCNITLCKKCSDPLFLYINGTFSACQNCMQLFGIYCYGCNIQHCQTCNYNYLLINKTCRCIVDRYISKINYDVGGNVIFQQCTLCNQTMIGCLQCAKDNCTKCAQNFTLKGTTNKICGCLDNFSFIDNTCQCINTSFAYKDQLCKPCKQIYQGCQTCNSQKCLTCQINYILRLGQCQCSGDRFLSNNLCTLCSIKYTGCLICTQFACSNCDNNYIVVNATCSCTGTDRYFSINQCKLCSAMTGCLTCTNYNQCTSCLNGYILVTSTSVSTCTCLSNYFINGSCVICNIYFGYGCLTCNNTCQSCITNYKMNSTTLANDFYNPCKQCSYFFNNCLTCNNNNCLSCKATYIMINSICSCPSNTILFNETCIDCTSLYQNCINCMPLSCILCKDNFTLASGVCQCSNDRYISGQKCIICNATYSNCQICTIDKCLSCNTNFILTNNLCQCSSPDRYFNNNKCELCSKIAGCLFCTSSTNCTSCGFNYTLINNMCFCTNGYSISQNKCLICSEIFGSGCLLCQSLANCSTCSQGYALNIQNRCLSCSIIDPLCNKCNMINNYCQSCNNNYSLINNKSCECLFPLFFIFNGNCTSCDIKYEKCSQCDQKRCISCVNNLTNINGICTCHITQYQYQQSCYYCNETFNLCLECNFSSCTTCISNFTLTNNSCVCLPPRTFDPQNYTCLMCTGDSCILQIFIDFLQIGKILYFKLKYNKKQSEINYKTPIFYNLKASINNKNIRFQQKDGLFNINLQNIDQSFENQINLLIQNKNYITWQDLTLSNNPPPLPYNLYQSQFPLNQQIIITILQKINSYSYIILILSFISFNRFFQQTAMLQMLLLSNYKMDNNIGNLLHLSSIHRNYKIIPNKIIDNPPGQLNQNMQISNLKYYIYGFNQSIISICQQIFIATIISIVLFIYVRGYLLTKRYQKQFAFKNIVQFGPQYVIQNIISLCCYLLPPLLVHFHIFLSNSNLYSFNHYIDAIVAMFVLLVPLMLIIIKLFKYPPSQKRYSVAYGPLKAQKKMALLFYLFNSLRPYFIGILVIFFTLSYQICNYVVLGINLLNLSLLLINIYNFTSKISLVLKLIKFCLGIFINIAFQLQLIRSSMIDNFSSYVFLSILLIEVIQSIVGLIVVILRNKKIISDLQPLTCQQKINEQSKQNKQKVDPLKQGKKQLLNSLAKARDQLSAMLQQRRNKNKKA